jgi:4-hydroxybenzoate polyprenyltransferase
VSLQRALDYVFFLRPVLLLPVWTTFLLGCGRTDRFWPTAAIAIGMLSLSAAFGAAFVLNQYFDVEGDRRNRKCPFISSGRISRPSALRYYGLLLLLALGTAIAIPWAIALILAVLALGVLYSAPPWRWKDRPYAALFANALAHGGVVFLCGQRAAGVDLLKAVTPALPYLFGVAAVYLLTTIPDLEGDRETGKRTLAVTLGPERTARWALGWYLSAVLLALYTVDVLFVLGVLPSAPWFVRVGRGRLEDVSRASRWAVAGLSAAAVITHPWYAIVLAAGWVCTRAYYRWQWNLRYP